MDVGRFEKNGLMFLKSRIFRAITGSAKILTRASLFNKTR